MFYEKSKCNIDTTIHVLPNNGGKNHRKIEYVPSTSINLKQSTTRDWKTKKKKKLQSKSIEQNNNDEISHEYHEQI